MQSKLQEARISHMSREEHASPYVDAASRTKLSLGKLQARNANPQVDAVSGIVGAKMPPHVTDPAQGYGVQKYFGNSKQYVDPFQNGHMPRIGLSWLSRYSGRYKHHVDALQTHVTDGALMVRKQCGNRSFDAPTGYPIYRSARTT